MLMMLLLLLSVWLWFKRIQLLAILDAFNIIALIQNFPTKTDWLTERAHCVKKEGKNNNTHLRFWNSIFHSIFICLFTCKNLRDRNKYKTHSGAIETSIESEWMNEWNNEDDRNTWHHCQCIIGSSRFQNTSNCFVCSRRICSHLHFCRIYILIHLLHRHNFQHVKLLKV